MARKKGCGCKRGGSILSKSFSYALKRTAFETVRDHNRKVRPQISREEDAWLAYLACQSAKEFF